MRFSAMKQQLGSTNGLYPLPTVLVGTIVNGTVNFTTIAHVGIVAMKTISVSMNKTHFSNTGIRENGTFSVNLPSVEQVKETDYCGIVTGKDTDKSHVFSVFYGRLKTAPMIQECPLTMECRLVKTLDLSGYDVFIGEIEGTYCDDSILTQGKIDIGKLRPLLFEMHGKHYWTIGQPTAKAWSIGKQLNNK
jgi:flavin reductase (DIM6/NTAB) family NADH-FMN oxidoreductase RutF